MTAVDDSPGGVADALMSGVGSDYRLCVEYWRDRAHMAEQELKDLLADVEASTQVDLLERYRRVCVERSVLVGQLATARAQAEALKGNR